MTRGRPGRRRALHVCGECAACPAGRYNICRKLGFVGLAGSRAGSPRSASSSARWVHPLGDLPTDVGALVEPLAVAYHAVRLSGLQPGGTAVVFGAGPIGLVTTAALKAAGAEQVIVVEPAAARKAKAPGAGADVVLDPTEVERARRGPRPDRRRGRRRRVRVRRASTPVLGVGDRLGAPRRHRASTWRSGATRRRVAMNDLVFSEINLIGSLAYCDDHPDTIGLLRDGKVDAEPVHHRPDRARRPRRRRLPRADRQQGGEREDPRLAAGALA